jgi:hypothetical protein
VDAEAGFKNSWPIAVWPSLDNIWLSSYIERKQGQLRAILVEVRGSARAAGPGSSDE